MKLVYLLAIVALSSCAASRPYAEAAAVGGWVADGASTYYKIEHDGCREANPIIESVSPAGLLGLNVLVAGTIYYFREYIPVWTLWVSGVVKNGLAYHNMTTDCTP